MNPKKKEGRKKERKKRKKERRRRNPFVSTEKRTSRSVLYRRALGLTFLFRQDQ